MGLKPLVTGVSPKDGYPGTKVIIRGENLGKDEDDLVAVRICGVDCTLRAKWEKESRITAYTGLLFGKGDIVIVTESGGIGTSSVGFQGLIKKSIGSTEETCVWIDEDAKSILGGLKRTAVNDISLDNPLRISADDSSKLTSDFLEQKFANTSIDMTKESFNSMRFLLENYQNAKFEDLKSGLNHLRSNIGSKAANSSDHLLKTNISSFMDAIKIMKDIYILSKTDKKNDFSKQLEKKLKDILKSAHKIYDQDLVSKDKADNIRNSLQHLETYKSLIYFPQNVDKLLKNEDYESIINNYKLSLIQLSKAQPATRKSQLFALIKTEMDNKIIEVQTQILDKLIQFPSSPDEQKALIEYHNTLQTYITSSSFSANVKQGKQVSPAWYCLIEEKKWLIHLMIECRDMHIADEKVSSVLKQSGLANADKKDEHQTPQTQLGGKQVDSDATKIQAMTALPHERNKFIEELCQMFFDIFSDYWRLGAMYMNNMLTFNANQTKKQPVAQEKQHTSDDYYALVAEILNTFSNIIRAAFIPHTFKQQNITVDSNSEKSGKSLIMSWPIKHDAKIISQILPHCLRVCRMCAMQIYSLDIPPALFETVQHLVYDLRCECLIILLSTPTREILALSGFEEQDWIVDRDIDQEMNCCLITNLPIRFEAKVTKALTLSKEFVLNDKKGEKALFRDATFVNKVAMLLYGILHAFLKRITRFMKEEDQLPKFLTISRGKLLLYLFNNLTLCKRKILPNIWNVIAQHKYKQIDQVIKESKKNVKDLQDSLLKQYMIETIGPIIDSIENNLYVGRYDFSDSSPPTAVRNYIKLIIMGMLNVHSELFLLNKTLISVVFTYSIKEIYTQLLKLFSDVPKFGQNAAIQTYIDIFCLRETFKVYTSEESKDLIKKILELVPSNSFEDNKKLMTSLISDFQKTMLPYISVMQQVPPSSSISVSFNLPNSPGGGSSTPEKKDGKQSLTKL